MNKIGIHSIGFDEFLPVNDVYADRINSTFERPIKVIWQDFKPYL